MRGWTRRIDDLREGTCPERLCRRPAAACSICPIAFTSMKASGRKGVEARLNINFCLILPLAQSYKCPGDKQQKGIS